MAFPVTLNGRTYTLADFAGTSYVEGLPDAFEDFVTQAGSLYSTTSTTSNAIGTGSKTFTVEASKPYQVGTPLRIADTAAPSTNWIDGIVTAYSGTTLTVNAVAYAGSGTKTAWSINIGGGPIAYTGTLPVAQGGTGATTAADARTNLDTYSKAEADSRFLNVSGEASDVTMTGNVTIGDASSDTLTINATTTIDGDSGMASGTGTPVSLQIKDTSAGSSWVAGDVHSALDFFSSDGSGVGNGVRARIGIAPTSAVNGASDLVFQTAPTTAGTMVTAMTIDENGLVGIGTSSPQDALQVNGVARLVSTTPTLRFYETDGTADENYQIRLNDGALTFQTNNDAFDAASTKITVLQDGNVGIGDDAPATKLWVEDTDAEVYDPTGNTTSNARIVVRNQSPTTGSYASIALHAENANSTVGQWTISSVSTSNNYDNHLTFLTRTGSSTYEERLRIDSSGNVGIGTSSPTQPLHVFGNQTRALIDTANTAATVGVSFTLNGSAGGSILYNHPSDYMRFDTGGTERLRIDSSGNVLVGTTSTAISNEGAVIFPSGVMTITNDGGRPLRLNRKTSDGNILDFDKDGTTVGSIGNSHSSGHIGIFSPSSGIGCYSSGIYPINGAGSASDNSKDLGSLSVRWDDVYATNGTIQTSDANEKQDIAELDEAEKRVAVAAKGLIRKYRWKDAVAEKGDDARIHVGIIAQDLQAAFEAEGLDAGRYAMFISSTWWEKERVIPAIEAQDAVYEDVVIPAVLDDEGNEIEPETTETRLVSEAIKGQEERTVIDHFETAEEAPEGATERTRLGVRYPELLAFIIGAL